MTPLALPDLPRWIEAHGIAADPAAWRRELGGGFAVGLDQARLAVVAGDADPEATGALAREYAEHVVLAAIEREDLAARLRMAGRTVARAVLHTLPVSTPVAELDGAIPLPVASELAHVPVELADELARAAREGIVWTAVVDGEPVSFGYAPWRTARWFEVAVETLRSARQLGLGAIVAAALIAAERAQGREPVWGADESNVASLRLARRLGFVAVDAIWVAAP